jgi:hypothetical protein
LGLSVSTFVAGRARPLAVCRSFVLQVLEPRVDHAFDAIQLRPPQIAQVVETLVQVEPF